MLDFGAWVLVGALMGWLGSRVFGASPLQVRLLNVVTGIVGAFLAALILTPLLGAGLPQNSGLSLPALVVALFGAVGLLAVINPGRRGSSALDQTL